MATSLKTSDIAQSSDSYEEDACQPCLFDDRTVTSERFCIDCEEYLCTRCSEYHRTLKATRNHELVSKKEAKKSSRALFKDKCSAKCTVPGHKDKTVKYFCKAHNVLGCSVCITMTHKQCDNNVDYIPQVAADIKHNDDFKKFNENLKAIEAACQAGISDIKKNLKVTETDHDKLRDTMQQFRKQVIGALDKLENELMTKAGSIMRKEKKKLDNLSKKLSKHQADANAMIKQADYLLSSGKHCDAYLQTKMQAKQLISLDEELKRTTRGNPLQRYEFRPNMNILKNIQSGNLTFRTEESISSYAVAVPDTHSDRSPAQRSKPRTSDGSTASVPAKTSDHPMAETFKSGTRVQYRYPRVDALGRPVWGRPTGTVVGLVDRGGVCEVRWNNGDTDRRHVSSLLILH